MKEEKIKEESANRAGKNIAFVQVVLLGRLAIKLNYVNS